MTTERRFERDLPSILDELAMGPYPDFIEDVLATTAQRRQRPAWTFPERWLPVDITTRAVLRPSLPWRQLGLLALIALLIAAALAAYIGSRPRLPSPFGVAANGVVAFADADGAIQEVDPTTGQATLLVAGPGNDRPTYSPSGARLAYLRDATSGVDIVVAGSRGERPLVITPKPLGQVGYLGWSPDETTVLVSLPTGQLQAYAVTGPSEPRLLSVEGQQLGSQGFDDFNGSIQDMYRPPMGSQILFLGTTADGPALFVADTNGTNPKSILDPAHSDIPYADLDVPQWSPDGSRIALGLASPDDPDQWHIYVLNADGTGLRRLSDETRRVTEGTLAWSPDGTRIAFQRWFYTDLGGFNDTQPITVVGVDDGTQTQVGIRNVDGYRGWSWSPDGTAILEVAQNTAEARLQIAPLDGGPPTYVEVTPASAPTWQRRSE